MNSEIKAFALAERYLKMDEADIGRLGSGGYGADRQKQYFADIRELARLAKVGSAASR